MTLKYLTMKGVLYAHRVMLEKYGGQDGVRAMDALESCVNQPQQQFGGQDLYPDIFSKAAAYVFLICKNHPFLDGNKRTTAFTMLLFLELNGYEFTAENDDFENMILDIAQSKEDMESITNWIKTHSQPLT